MTAYLISLALVGLVVIVVSGGLLVSFDIIQFISRLKRDDMQTDFPTIAFRSARQNLASDPVDASPGRCAASAIRKA